MTKHKHKLKVKRINWFMIGLSLAAAGGSIWVLLVAPGVGVFLSILWMLMYFIGCISEGMYHNEEEIVIQ